MTEPFDTLLEVQLHDTTLDQLRRRKVTLPEQAELRAVEERAAALTADGAELRSRVDELAARQRSLEEQIASSAARRHTLEQRMLGGEVTAARDLQAMDTEVHHLAERQAEFEEQELALVEEEDPLDVALAENERSLAELAEEARRLRTVVEESLRSIDESIAVEEGERAEVAVRLPADLADRYEALRSHLGGVGAARLVGDQCDGCHLTLPSKEVERIRRLPPEEFATCDQCGRILVH
jgi:predicted  nucleic acid-binding Zn-ribbon protein